MKSFRNKKLYICIIIILSIMVSSGVISATEKYISYADELYNLGLFKGTNQGYELDREPTRAEGAIMFVRLLGKEDEALLNDYSHPFNDVPTWASPYVGFLYQNNLTKGISNTSYGSVNLLDSKSYMTFILRLLGYADGEDFDWEYSLEFAYAEELINPDFFLELKYDTFYRDQMVKLSYDSLSFTYVDSDVTVLANIQINRNNNEKTQIEIGDRVELLLNTYGQPNEIVDSRYDCKWYIYCDDYSNYFQIGIKDYEVVAIYTTSENTYSDGVFKTNKATAISSLGNPLTEIKKLHEDINTIYSYKLDTEESMSYIIDNKFTTYYVDIHDNDNLYAVLIIDYDHEYDNALEYEIDLVLLNESFEIQMHNIENAIRAMFNLKPLMIEAKAATSAKKHSTDMAQNDYFSHTNLDGESPFDRMSNEGIKYSSAGENLAYSYSAITACNGLFNSIGHREITLGDFDNIGIGVASNNNRVYYTQNLWR